MTTSSAPSDITPATAITRLPVRFSGGRARVAPLGWGQETTWLDILDFLPEIKSFMVLVRRVPVPPGLTLDDVLGEVARLTERHEALRTLVRSAPGGRTSQHVLAEGTVTTVVFDWPSACPEPFESVVDGAELELSGTGYDFAAEVAFRPCVGLRDGVPAIVLFSVSHVVADVYATHLLASDLGTLLDARSRRVPVPPAPPAWQPADIAEAERAPGGQMRNADALRYLRRQYERIPPSMFGAPVPGEQPRFWRGRLSSRALPMALRVLARRYRTGYSAVLLAATVAAIRAVSGTELCSLGLVLANRVEPGARHAITSLSQTVLATVDSGVATFGDLVRAAADAAAQAQEHARHDRVAADRIMREVGRKRAVTLDLTCRFNDIWSSLPKPRPKELPSPETIREALAASAFDWTERTSSDKITLFVDIDGDADTLNLNVLADTYRIPPDRVRAMQIGFEAMLVALVAGDLGMPDALGRFQDH